MYVAPILDSKKPELKSCVDQFTCSEGKSCAYDDDLGVFGCFSTAEPALTTDAEGAVGTAGHEMFTSCLGNVIYTNCGMTCVDSPQVTTW